MEYGSDYLHSSCSDYDSEHEFLFNDDSGEDYNEHNFMDNRELFDEVMEELEKDSDETETIKEHVEDSDWCSIL